MEAMKEDLGMGLLDMIETGAFLQQRRDSEDRWVGEI